MGLKFPYKLESFNLEVGGPSYGQNKNIGCNTPNYTLTVL